MLRNTSKEHVSKKLIYYDSTLPYDDTGNNPSQNNQITKPKPPTRKAKLESRCQAKHMAL